MRRFAAAGVWCAILFLFPNLAAASNLEIAMSKAEETGRPLLVLVTSPTSGYCTALKTRMRTDSSLKEFVSQYVAYEIDANSPEMAMWSPKHTAPASGFPQIFVATPQGNDIFAIVGSPQGDNLPKLLKAGLALNEECKKADEKLKKAKAALKKQDITAVVATFAGIPDSLEPKRQMGVISYPPTAYVELNKIKKELVAQAELSLDKAETHLSTTKGSLPILLKQVAIRRYYGSIASVREKATKLFDEIQKDETGRDLLKQAEQIDQGDAFKAAGKTSQAVSAYREVMEQFPDTAAAKIAERRVALIAPHTAVAENASRHSSGKTSNGAAAKKAASRLNMAKLYAKLNPEKAKQFAQEAIDASAADSPTAAEAKKLLEDLSQQN